MFLSCNNRVFTGFLLYSIVFSLQFVNAGRKVQALAVSWPQVHWPRISYKSRVIVFFSIKASTSVFLPAGRILMRVLEANLYLALFLWSPWGMSANMRWAVW